MTTNKVAPLQFVIVASVFSCRLKAVYLQLFWFFPTVPRTKWLSTTTITTRLYHDRANIHEAVILTAVTELNIRRDTFKTVKLLASDWSHYGFICGNSSLLQTVGSVCCVFFFQLVQLVQNSFLHFGNKRERNKFMGNPANLAALSD